MEICPIKLYENMFNPIFVSVYTTFKTVNYNIFQMHIFIPFFCINLFTHCLGIIQVILTAYDIVVITEETHR